MNDHLHPDREIRIKGLLKKREVVVRDLEEAQENLEAIDHEIACLRSQA